MTKNVFYIPTNIIFYGKPHFVQRYSGRNEGEDEVTDTETVATAKVSHHYVQYITGITI